MRIFSRPTVVVSRCIEFEHCRWNGDLIPSDVVQQLKPHVDFIPVCPEADIGLGIPRPPLRLVRSETGVRVVQPATGRDVTGEMDAFTTSFISGLGVIDGFILKGRSPTSAMKDAVVYASADRGAGKVAKGPGFFSSRLMAAFPDAAIEDEGRLRNARIKDHFLISLFLSSDFRQAREAGSPAALRAFQTTNELLLHTYHARLAVEMSRIASEAASETIEASLDAYEVLLHRVMAKAPSCGTHADTLHDVFGRMSARLSADEVALFEDSVAKYRAMLLPFSVPVSVLRTWMVRFKQTSLASQSFFQPFPESLIDLNTMTAYCDGKDYWS
ncbi:MAG: DUF1722 domain-containing protein [Dehalococcoidia bacterium]|nr:DUF1722 domain-containing protein [Dehalococcoidia bacterium]